MPLSPPAERELLHQRDIQLRGYHRADGNFDIEATLVDTKTAGFGSPGRGYVAPGEPLHQMRVRMTIDEAMTILACEAVTENGPFPVCAGGAASMSHLAGLTIKAGFLKAANQMLGGITGCTHLRELLQQMATVALQTMWPIRSKREAAALASNPADAGGKPRAEDGSARMLNTCFGYASSSPVVKQRWPHLYTGPDASHPAPEAPIAPVQMAAAVSARD